MQEQTQNTLTAAIAQMKLNPFLNKLAKGGHSSEVWQKFGAERLFIADECFVPLLSWGRDKAESAGEPELARVINDNILDELGLDYRGWRISKSHAEVRREFYKEIGVTDEVLSKTRSNRFSGTLAYQNAVTHLMSDGTHYLGTAGAILYIETTLSAELTLVLKAATEKFSNLSEQSLWYLRDHIYHDADDHGPRLKKALVAYMEPEDEIHLIQGINELKEAKENFYSALYEELLRE